MAGLAWQRSVLLSIMQPTSKCHGPISAQARCVVHGFSSNSIMVVLLERKKKEGGGPFSALSRTAARLIYTLYCMLLFSRWSTSWET